MRFRFQLSYEEFLDHWKYQLLETASRLVCKCVRYFGDRIFRRSCQEVRRVNFDHCSVYRTKEPGSICGHGLNFHHSLHPTQNVYEIFPLNQFCYFTLYREKFKKFSTHSRYKFMSYLSSLIKTH